MVGRTDCGIGSGLPTMIPTPGAARLISSSFATKSETWPGFRISGERSGRWVPPTVLDGNLSDAFFPAPLGAETGHTLDLSNACDSPCREVLHPTFAFGAKHLWRIGSIRKSVNLSSLATLRGLHLIWLRKQTGVADYAADTDGGLL